MHLHLSCYKDNGSLHELNFNKDSLGYLQTVYKFKTVNRDVITTKISIIRAFPLRRKIYLAFTFKVSRGESLRGNIFLLSPSHPMLNHRSQNLILSHISRRIPVYKNNMYISILSSTIFTQHLTGPTLLHITYWFYSPLLSLLIDT